MGPTYGHVGDAAWGWGLLGPVLSLLLWGGLILGVVLLVRGGSLGAGGDRPAPPHPPEDRALAILRERYARGEIDSADYEERRRRLLDETPTL